MRRSWWMCAEVGRRGQSTIEYAVLAAVLVGALLAMQIYVKRGISGRLRLSADSIGTQYAPRKATSDMTQKVISDTTTKSKILLDQPVGAEKADVMVTETIINNDSTSRTGSEHVEALGTDLWK